MSALWLVAGCWIVAALLLAAVIGRAVRIADKDAALTAELNFVVDEHPLPALTSQAFTAADSYGFPTRGTP
ncbi:hypothetical protein [Blastococcus sp. TBT05-19]|uniref:hypothetical protein n=1 Tax=Blastococcus sp. TBT05-19 TaxID=2250581 RepID=UPI0011BFD325|nr:hypothetical protein [Blastococcus sp. TBT05-19]